MNFGNEKPSNHWENHIGETLLQALLNVSLASKGHPLTGGAPNGHAKWMTDVLNQMTPQDIEVMKAQGLTAEQFLQMKYQASRISDPASYDASVYPYNDDFGKQIIKTQRGH